MLENKSYWERYLEYRKENTVHTHIEKQQYFALPSRGKKIQICGEISKIGFSFDYVETARDNNMSGI